MRAPKWSLKETRGNRGEWLRSIRPKRARPRPHPRYRLGLGRVKSLPYNFGDSDQWVGVVSLLECPQGLDQLVAAVLLRRQRHVTGGFCALR